MTTVKKTDVGIQNMMSGAGVSRTIWRDLRFSGQSEVLLEFLPIKPNCMLLVEADSCLSHAPTSGAFFAYYVFLIA